MSGAGPVAILAGAGDLPGLVASRLAEEGRDVRLLAFRGIASRETCRRADAVVGLLDLRGSIARLEAWSPRCVALAGGVARPSPAVLLDAFAMFRSRDEIARVIGRGDDNLLRGAIGLLEERGHRLVGVDELVPELLAPAGPIGRREADGAQSRTIATGLALLDAISPFDIGQAAVLRGERVLAVEGPEGTDRALARAGRVSRVRPFARPQPGAILVKAAKLGQDRRVDLPAVGPRTVRNAARAGLSGIAVASGSTLVIDRPGVAALADRLGLFVVGIERDAAR